MNHSTFQRVVEAALAAALLCCAPPVSLPVSAATPRRDVPATPRPNVLLVVIDTLRKDHLGLYGYGKPTSPRLDALARESVVFDRCVAASSWTEPSTASLLSGLYPARHGCHEYAAVPDDALMLAEVLKEAGYRTLGLSGNPNASPLFGFKQGFDRFWLRGDDAAREYPDVSEIIDEAEKLLASDDEAPLFLYLHLMNVHGPYLSPPGWRERFLEPPASDFAFRNPLWMDIMRRTMLERRADVTPAHLRDLAARYDGAIAWTDEVVGRFLAGRRAQRGYERDLVIVTSDHGEELFDHGGFGHGQTLHGEVVDVPLVVRRPGGTGAGSRVDAPVSLVDLPATILELAGLLPEPARGRFGDGLSLVPLMDGGSLVRDQPIVAQLDRVAQGKAFLVEQWPLRAIAIEQDYMQRFDVFELYDVAADPREEHDLAPEDAARASTFRVLIAERRKALEAQALHAQKLELDDELRRQMERLGYGAGGAADGG